MKRHLLLILTAAALPFGVAHADEADGSQFYRSGMAMNSQWAPAAQAGTPMQMQMPMQMQSTAMGAPARALTREQVRADAIQAMQRGTITRGEKGGFPH